MALRRPHKGMKMGPAQCFNVDWDPRRWDWIPAFAGMTMWGGWVLFSEGMTVAQSYHPGI